MNTRIVLSADNLQKLMEGGIVDRRNSRLPSGCQKISIMLEDMGFNNMQDRLNKAITCYRGSR